MPSEPCSKQVGTVGACIGGARGAVALHPLRHVALPLSVVTDGPLNVVQWLEPLLPSGCVRGGEVRRGQRRQSKYSSTVTVLPGRQRAGVTCQVLPAPPCVCRPTSEELGETE